MYCTECGKNNPDKAKYCAYCGAKLLKAEPAAEPEVVWEAESRFDSPAPQNEAVWAKPVQPAAEVHEAEPVQPAAQPKRAESAPVRRVGKSENPVRASRPRAEEPSPWSKPEDTVRARQAARDGAPSTIVPVHGRGSEPVQDLFFDGYDAAPAPVPRRNAVKRRREKKPSFFEQNLRGVVGIGMTLGTLLLLAAWLYLMPSGQQMMARFGLTDNPAAYAAIAQNAYQAQNYSTAAQNYYQALLLDDDNYDYALMTAECYRLAGSTGQASTALTLAIGINASDVRAYRMLQQLYPVVQTRPAAVSQLLQQGATLTGDASLNQ